MNQLGAPDAQTVAARRLLLDVLEGLGDSRKQVVLIGAQAVLLRIGPTSSPVVLATFDGDIGVDPRNPPGADLARVLDSLGLGLLEKDGHPQPGTWVQKAPSEKVQLSIDLLVPEAFSPKRGKRAAAIDQQQPNVARYVKGIEASLTDKRAEVVASFDPGDRREMTVPVAGAGALVIAKLHKLSDRLGNERRPDRVHSKDCYEVLRLMQLPVSDVVDGWAAAAGAEVSRQVSLEATGLLDRLFAADDGVGAQLASDHVAEFEDSAVVRASARTLARELVESVRSRT